MSEPPHVLVSVSEFGQVKECTFLEINEPNSVI